MLVLVSFLRLGIIPEQLASSYIVIKVFFFWKISEANFYPFIIITVKNRNILRQIPAHHIAWYFIFNVFLIFRVLILIV